MKAEWDSDLVKAGLAEVDSLRDSTNLIIRDLINSYHKCDNSTDYYEILLGDWAEHFLHAIYAAYVKMLLPFTLKIEGRLPLQEFTLKSYGNYDSGINFQLNLHENVNSIVSGTFDIDKKDYKNKRIIFHNSNDESKLFKCTRLLLSKNPKVIFSSPRFYCSNKEFFSQLILWRRWASVNNFCFPINLNIDINSRWRKNKSKEQKDGSELNQIVQKLLPVYIPSIFLEGLQNFKKICLDNTKDIRPNILYGTTSLHSNLVFKLLAAEWKQQGTKLYYHQHGGGYGIDANHTLENYESRVSDHYFTWGWTDENKKNISPLSLPWAYRFKKNINKKNNILLNCVDYQKIFIRMHYQPMLGSIEKMHSQTFDFLVALKEEISITIRPYHYDYNWGFVSKMKKIRPNSALDISSKKSIKRFHNYDLIVHNSLGTGYLESMALNIPTLCMYDVRTYKFRDSALVYLNSLQEVGILQTSGKLAGEFINKNMDSIFDWWFSNEVQAARSKFIEAYAKFDSEWASSWEAVFESSI